MKIQILIVLLVMITTLGLAVEAHSRAADQCNTTKQCQAIYGNRATDCLDSRSNTSVCMCGSERCDSSTPGNPSSPGKTLFSLDFDKDRPGSPLKNGSSIARRYSKVTANCGPTRGNCLTTRYVKDRRGSPRQGAKFSIKPGRAYTLQYDVKFAKNFEFVRGGKLHGLGPDKSTTGCKPQVANGWSTRVMWRKNGVAELYIYDQTRKAKRQKCGWSYRTKGPVLKKGKWQAISMYMKLNSVGRSDGEAELWIDGKRQVRKTGIKFRGSSKNTLISRFQFSTFFGGADPSWSPSRTVSVQTDNFKVVEGRGVRRKAGR